MLIFLTWTKEWDKNEFQLFLELIAALYTSPPRRRDLFSKIYKIKIKIE